MGRTMIQKILAQNSGASSVEPGEIVEARIDTAMIHDATGGPTVLAFRDIGRPKVWDPEHVIILFDHSIPAPSESAAKIQKLIRDFAREQGIQNLDVRPGVCHQVMPEEGWIYPGAIVVGTDSHTCTAGAFGAFGTGIGSTEMAAVFVTGKLWFKVPESIKVMVGGAFPAGVFGKDLVLYLCGKLTAEGASYMAMEFAGPAVDSMPLNERMTVCNMAIEMGAKTGMMEPNAEVLAYVEGRARHPFTVVKADPDAQYSRTISVDAAALEPQVACPATVDNVKPLREVAGLPINQAFLGSCTNGRLEDLHLAAKVLNGRQVHPDVRLLVVPASARIYREALADGTLMTLADAGAVICNPGCGPCFGGHQGLMAEGERCIASSNRNFKGRMGKGSEVYLASPMSVAAAALTGRITDPRQFL